MAERHCDLSSYKTYHKYKYNIYVEVQMYKNVKIIEDALREVILSKNVPFPWTLPVLPSLSPESTDPRVFFAGRQKLC